MTVHGAECLIIRERKRKLIWMHQSHFLSQRQLNQFLLYPHRPRKQVLHLLPSTQYPDLKVRRPFVLDQFRLYIYLDHHHVRWLNLPYLRNRVDHKILSYLSQFSYIILFPFVFYTIMLICFKL